MNTKIRSILAAGMLVAMALPMAACAKKTQPSETTGTIPTIVEVSIHETAPAEQKAETVTPATPVWIEEDKIDTVNIIELGNTAVSSEQKSASKATKTARTAKKAAKKTAKKTSKKTAKKSVKKTTGTGTSTSTRKSALPELYSFGNSEYVCKGITIKMFIKKNNRATITITYNSQDRNDHRREIYFTMNGTVDRNTNTLTYSNCRKQELVYTNLGLLSNKVDYRNGKGEIKFKKGFKLVWKDSMEHFADSHKFRRTR